MVLIILNLLTFRIRDFYISLTLRVYNDYLTFYQVRETLLIYLTPCILVILLYVVILFLFDDYVLLSPVIVYEVRFSSFCLSLPMLLTKVWHIVRLDFFRFDISLNSLVTNYPRFTPLSPHWRFFLFSWNPDYLYKKYYWRHNQTILIYGV